MSFGVPPRFIGIELRHSSTALGSIASVISVSINPGAIALHLIFLDPNSSATDFVNPINPVGTNVEEWMSEVE